MLTLVALAVLPMLAAFLVASFRNPMGVALPTYAAVLPFGQSISTGLPGKFGSVSSLLGIMLGIALLVQLATSRRAVLRPPASLPAWLALLALAGASISWSLLPRTTALSFLALSSLVLLFAVIAIAQVQRRDLVRLEDGLLVGGAASACYGLLQLAGIGGLPSGGTPGAERFGADLLGPNNQAAALLLPLAIVLGRLVLRSRGGLPLNLSLTALILLSILMTGSRGGLLALAVTGGVLILALPKARRAAMVGTGAAALVLIALILVVNPAGIGQRQLSAEGGSGRAEVWSVGMHACETYCVTGSGWGTFPEVYEEQRASVPEARVLRRGTAYEPHNVWMLVGIELGLLGLILLGGALALTVRSAARLPSALRGPPLAALSGIVVAGFFLSFLEYKFVWIALIYVVMCRNYAASHREQTPERVAVRA